MTDDGGKQGQRPPRGLLGAAAGAVLGFGVGIGVYLLVNPRLEASNSGIEEFQGLLWNIVPVLTGAGALLGWWVLRPHRHH